jgi:hypothetical protein
VAKVGFELVNGFIEHLQIVTTLLSLQNVTVTLCTRTAVLKDFYSGHTLTSEQTPFNIDLVLISSDVLSYVKQRVTGTFSVQTSYYY